LRHGAPAGRVESVSALYKMIINQGTVEAKYKNWHTFARRWSTAARILHAGAFRVIKRAGVTAEQIAAPFYKRSPLFDEKEKATILYSDRVTRAATTIRAAELEDLRNSTTKDKSSS